MEIPAQAAANEQTSWSNFGHVTIVAISGPNVRAQNGRVCGKWVENLIKYLILSRSWQLPDQKFELKMELTGANGKKTWSTFGHVTILIIFGPKVRAQNGAVWCKRPENLINFWSCHDRDNFRTKSSSSKWTCLLQMGKKVGQILVLSRSWQFRYINFRDRHQTKRHEAIRIWIRLKWTYLW